MQVMARKEMYDKFPSISQSVIAKTHSRLSGSRRTHDTIVSRKFAGFDDNGGQVKVQDVSARERGNIGENLRNSDRRTTRSL